MAQSRLQRLIDSAVTHTLLILISAAMLFPVLFSLMTSFKQHEGVLTLPPTFFPPTWTLEGYRIVMQSDLVRYYLPNSAINALTATFTTLLFATLAAYVFSRFKFRGSAARCRY